MKTSLKLLFLLLIMTFFSCLKEKESKKNNELKELPKKQNYTSQNVVVTGTTDDPEAFLVFNITKYVTFAGRPHNSNNEKVVNDSIHIVLDSVTKPQIMDIFTMGKPLLAYRARMYVTPGDTINFTIKNEKIRFSGKNALQYNFMTELDEILDLDYGRNPYKGNILEYKKRVKSIYERRTQIFNDFVKAHEHEISSGFITTVREDLKFQYLHNLMDPRIDNIGIPGMYFNKADALTAIIEKEYGNKEQFFDYKAYFDNVSIDDFKAYGLQTTHYFKNSVNPFIRYYFDSSDDVPYSKEKLIAEKQFIETNFDGELKNYAIARMIWDYNQKGFGYSKDNNTFMNTLIDAYYDKFTDASYREAMDKIRESLNSSDFELSEAALNTKLVSKYGDTITLKEIFGRSKKRIKVIDFWASWCAPCIDGITKAKSFKDRMSVENNVEWIYLSVDEDQKRWLKKSEELKDYLNVEHQYFVLKGTFTPLARALKIQGIPRYVIFNKQNQIVLDNAPRPSDSLVFKKIIDAIE